MAVARTASSPFSVAKMVMQTQPTRFEGASMVQVLRQINAQEGYRALWRGNFTWILHLFTNRALSFHCFLCRQGAAATERETGVPARSTFNGRVLAVWCSQLARTVIVHPLEVIRTRLATDMTHPNTLQREYTGIYSCLRATYATGGSRALFAGLGISVTSFFPSSAVFIASLLTLNDLHASYFGEDTPSNPLVPFAIAHASALVASLVVYPLDTWTRVVMKGTESRGGAPAPKFQHIWHHARAMYTTYGLRKGFYGGVTATAVHGLVTALALLACGVLAMPAPGGNMCITPTQPAHNPGNP